MCERCTEQRLTLCGRCTEKRLTLCERCTEQGLTLCERCTEQRLTLCERCGLMNEHPVDLALGTMVREDDHLAVLVLHVAMFRPYARPIQNCTR